MGRVVTAPSRTLTRRSGDELMTDDAIQLRHAAERPGIGLPQPPIDLMRLHAGAQRRAPAAGEVRLVDVACADVLERTLHSLQVLARIILGDRRLHQPLCRVRQARDASQIACDPWNQVGGSGLGDDPATTAVVLVNHRGGDANRLRNRTGDRLRQPQARLDLPRKLVTKVDEPAAGEWHTTGLVARRRHSLALPPSIERREKWLRRGGCHELPGRMRKQNVEAAQRLAGRGALEERGIQVR